MHSPPFTTYSDASRKDRGLYLYSSLPLCSYFVFARSKSAGKTVRLGMLVFVSLLVDAIRIRLSFDCPFVDKPNHVQIQGEAESGPFPPEKSQKIRGFSEILVQIF